MDVGSAQLVFLILVGCDQGKMVATILVHLLERDTERMVLDAENTLDALNVFQAQTESLLVQASNLAESVLLDILEDQVVLCSHRLVSHLNKSHDPLDHLRVGQFIDDRISDGRERVGV